MNSIAQLEAFQAKGFSREQAGIILLMRAAAVALFRDFPEHFVLFGGATLVLFHESVRHSADLDLLSTRLERPSTEALLDSLERGLRDVAELLHLHPLSLTVEVAAIPELKIVIVSPAGERLFRVDFNRFGSLVGPEVEVQILESGVDSAGTEVTAASRDLLLFQKAEAFLLRRAVKARDAFDIQLLLREGAMLSPHLRALLTDNLLGQEIEAGQIEQRIQQLTARRCKSELEPVLPREVFQQLEHDDFSALHHAVRALFEEWL